MFDNARRPRHFTSITKAQHPAATYIIININYQMIQQSSIVSSQNSQKQLSNLHYTYLPTNIEKRKAKRGVNKGKCKTYVSPCKKYLNYNKKRMMKHIGSCMMCRPTTSNVITASIVNNMPPEFIPHVPRQSILQSQIDKLNDEMKNLKNELLNSSALSLARRIQYNDLEADELAQHVYQRNKIEIEQVIIKKIAIVISQSRKSKINIQNNLMMFGEKIVNQIRKLRFEECVEDCRNKLQKAHKQMMKGNFHQKTKQRYESCFQFLSRYTEIELKTFANVFEDFLKLSATKRRYLKIYWQNIKKINPYFSIFPQLPQLREEKIRRMTFSPDITIQKAGKRLLNLLAERKFELLCDIWLLLLLGLRFGDLLKVKLYNQNKEYYKFIKLIQNKNKNLTIRYIPLSLCQLCEYTSAVYPLNAVRLRAAVRYCLQNFRCAYGFKHKVISHIVAVFNQQSAFGRFHKSSSTTAQFYIDKNCEFLLNSIFKFPIALHIPQMRQHQLETRSIILDLTEKVSKDIIIHQDFENQIIMNDGVDISERMSILNSDGISLSEGQNSLEVSVAQNHHLQLSQRLHQHLGSAILAIDESNIIEDIERNLSQQSEEFDNRTVLKALSSISNRDVYFYQQSEHGIQQELFSPQTKSNQVQVVVTKNKLNKYQVTEVPISKFRQAKKKALQKFDYRRVDPYKLLCKICKQKKVFSRLLTDSWSVKCTNCNFSHHEKRQQTPYKSKLNIDWTGSKQHNYWGLAVVSNSGANQLSKSIDEQYPHAFKQNHLYCNDFPTNIRLSLPFIPAKLEKELEKALQFEHLLPLRIAKSTIPNAGRGIFATQRLGRNSLICCYKCVIGTSYSINSQLDSNFTIGWAEESDGTPVELIADGLTNVGVGRYINSKPDKQSNCRALIGVTSKQIYIFLVSKEKIIESGEQLFYYYGDRFFFQNEKSQNEVAESDQQIEMNEDQMIETY